MQRSSKKQNISKQTQQAAKKTHPCDPTAIVDNIIDEYVKTLREPNQTSNDKDLLSKLLGIDFDTKLSSLLDNSTQHSSSEILATTKSDNEEVLTNNEEIETQVIDSNDVQNQPPMDTKEEISFPPQSPPSDQAHLKESENECHVSSPDKVTNTCWNETKGLTTLEFTNSKIDRLNYDECDLNDYEDDDDDEDVLQNGLVSHLHSNSSLNFSVNEKSWDFDNFNYFGNGVHKPELRMIPSKKLAPEIRKPNLLQGIRSKVLNELLSLECTEISFLNEMKRAEERAFAEFREIRLALIKREKDVLREIRRCKEEGLATIRQRKSKCLKFIEKSVLEHHVDEEGQFDPNAAFDQICHERLDAEMLPKVPKSMLEKVGEIKKVVKDADAKHINQVAVCPEDDTIGDSEAQNHNFSEYDRKIGSNLQLDSHKESNWTEMLEEWTNHKGYQLPKIRG